MCMIDGLPCTPGTRVVWVDLGSTRTGTVIGQSSLPWGQDWSSLPPKSPCPYYTVVLDTPYTWATSNGKAITVAQLWVLVDALEVMREEVAV